MPSSSRSSFVNGSPPDAGGTTAGGALERGTVVTVTCGPMVHGGLCLSRLDDGTTVFVAGGIPDEVVHARLDYSKRRSWFATVLDAMEGSPHRVKPPCPAVPDCGGCQLQHVTYAHQLHLKREIVLDALRHAKVDVPDIVVHGMEHPWAYRWRGEFHVVPGAAGLADAELGFNRARSWTPIAVDDCLIHHRSIGDQLPVLRELVRTAGRRGLTTLHLTVGEDGRELLIRPNPRHGLDPAIVDDLAVRDGRLWSTDSTTLRWRDHVFRITPDTFIQVNWAGLEILYGIVLDAVGALDGLRIVDAYAGIGVLPVVMASGGAEVVCIESNPASVQMGLLNARLNGVEDRVQYVGADVADALPSVCRGEIDTLLLDPPRAGCGGVVTGWLALAGPERVIYVSCDPATLARDLKILVSSGPYVVERFDLVDMFPQTYHVESVAVLRRRP